MRKIILVNKQSPGDVLMLTAAVRDLHASHPGEFITDVRTSAPPLWEHNPHLTPIADDDSDAEHIQCEYPLIHRSNQLPYHFIHGFRKDLEAKLAVAIEAGPFRGDLHLSDEEKGWVSQVEQTGHTGPFWLIVAGGKRDFTAKWWSPQYYQGVVDRLKGKVTFVQVGAAEHVHPPLEGVINLVGKTDIRQLVRLVHHAEGIVCPVTFAMHLAMAVPTKDGQPASRPCVVIAGGREPSHWEAYPTHRYLHACGALECCEAGGCWRSRCQTIGDGSEKDRPEKLCAQPVDVAGGLRIPKCMFLIKPREVARAVESYYRGGVLKREVGLRATKEICFAGMKRSGNHPVLDWIVSQTAGKVAFLNNVARNELRLSDKTWPLPSLKDTHTLRDLQNVPQDLVVCSWEDVPPGEAEWMEHVRSGRRVRVLILRDPYNLLASTVGMGARKGQWAITHRPDETGEPRGEALAAWAARWKEYAREYLRMIESGDGEQVAVNYNRWVAEEAYRDEVFAALGLDARSDDSMKRVPGYGLGSSFDGKALDGRATEGRYLRRWKQHAADAWYCDVFRGDGELVALSEKIFGHIEGTEALLAPAEPAEASPAGVQGGA